MTASRCRCGCSADVHLHYRPGTDCGRCGIERCDTYIPADFTDAQAELYVALAPHALATGDIPENPRSADTEEPAP